MNKTSSMRSATHVLRRSTGTALSVRYPPHYRLLPVLRDLPYPGDMSTFPAEERWLRGEPREPNRWVIGIEEDKVRMARFRRRADR